MLDSAVAMMGMLWTGNGRLAGDTHKGKGHQIVEGLGRQNKASILKYLQVCDLRGKYQKGQSLETDRPGRRLRQWTCPALSS